MIKPKLSNTPSNIKRHFSSNGNKIKCKDESLKITRQGSAAIIDAVTFLQEDDDEYFTDDWGKSLLYKKLTSGEDLILEMTEQDMKILSRKPPRDHELREKVINKGLVIIRVLLMELLGTKEDMDRFEHRFKGNTSRHVQALLDKCLSLLHVRRTTADILLDINKRESILKNLEISTNKIKEKVLKAYSLNKLIREKITLWVKDESIPFSKFIFKNKDYLQKISEDSLLLQHHLSSYSLKSRQHPKSS